jgi:hypothetical protein
MLVLIWLLYPYHFICYYQVFPYFQDPLYPELSCAVQKVFFCIVIGHGKAHSIRAVFVGKTSRARVAECWLGRRAVVQKGSLISVIEMQTEVQLPFHIRQR